MGSRDLFLYIGPTGMGSQIEAAVEDRRLVVKETTEAGVSYLNDAGTSPTCVLTDHDPPERDCFELFDAVSAEVPVILAPNGGSSSLATRGLRAGAATYLDPTTLDDGAAALAAKIDRIATGRPPRAGFTDSSDDRIERFTSIVSHELRSPIQTAKSGIDLAKTQCDSEYLSNVEETIDQMDQLIDNLLDDIKYGETAVEMDAVDLGEVVEQAWADRRGATLSVESELPMIEAEPSRLRQLLDNLFRNSVEHGSTDNRTQSGDSVEHGSTSSRAKPDDREKRSSSSSRPAADDSVEHGGDGITVQIGVTESPDSSGSDDHIGLYIADDGPGIEPERREEIFEYGYTNSADGTGFGLAIVAEIVEAFDWDITVTESETGGARFELHRVKKI